MSELILLDVGHGNSAVLLTGSSVAVIDAPIGALLLDTLADLKIKTVEAAFISHADKDHIAGILSLLTSESIVVDRIYVNPDAVKRSKIWEDFRVAVSCAEKKGRCTVFTSLSSTAPGSVQFDDSTVTVVTPSASLALTGVGGKTKKGDTVHANTLSVALKVSQEGSGGVLLAADIDEIALADAMEHRVDLTARVLVFPHHGGLAGSEDVRKFSAKLISQVRPSSVVFSNGRGRHDNPRPEIVEYVSDLGCAVACTQLSERCSSSPVDASAYLEDIRAHGKSSGACCAGSMTITLGGGATREGNAEQRHRSFISSKVSTPMCRAGKRV